jgi:hypothetical protein
VNAAVTATTVATLCLHNLAHESERRVPATAGLYTAAVDAGRGALEAAHDLLVRASAVEAACRRNGWACVDDDLAAAKTTADAATTAGVEACRRYREQVMDWLDYGMVLCTHLWQKIVRKGSEQCHVLVLYPTVLLSMVLPAFINGVDVELDG